MATQSDQWHILGAGALGSVFASLFLQAGIPARLLTHRKQGEHRLVSSNASFEALPIPVDALQSLPQGSIERLLLTTKAFHVTPALQLVMPYLSTDAVVVCSANGLGYEAQAKEQLGKRPLYYAVSTEAALRESAHTVRHTGRGRTVVGGASQRDVPPWFSDSLDRLPGWNWSAHIEQERLRKFAINCAINPLTALHRCHNGALLETDRKEELLALCSEIEAVLKATGKWPTELRVSALVEEVCSQTAENRSSTLQDLLAGRPTEMAYLNGHLLDLGEKAGLELPRNRAILAALGNTG